MFGSKEYESELSIPESEGYRFKGSVNRPLASLFRDIHPNSEVNSFSSNDVYSGRTDNKSKRNQFELRLEILYSEALMEFNNLNETLRERYLSQNYFSLFNLRKQRGRILWSPMGVENLYNSKGIDKQIDDDEMSEIKEILYSIYFGDDDRGRDSLFDLPQTN